jgi:D-arabinose 1-dehydrogenase-like Zn-dependent alcohol dehydrogenase
MRKAAHVHGIAVGSRTDFEGMTHAIARHRVRPVVDRSFAFDDCAAAYEYMHAQSHVGKVTIGIA